MFNASIRNIVIALVTSAALLGVAFYQRYETPHHGSSVMFFILAAFICLPRFVSGLLRCMNRGKKPSIG